MQFIDHIIINVVSDGHTYIMVKKDLMMEKATMCATMHYLQGR